VGSVNGHQVREIALPSGLQAARVPPPACCAASRHAAEPAGRGHPSPVTCASRRASSAVAVPVTTAPASGRPAAAASQATAVHGEQYSGRTALGWRSSSAAAEVP
jgi:hypothetical protein